MAGVDTCVDSDLVDRDRVVFVGGNYGGYLTACAATMTDRAAAAAVISSHPDLLSARHGKATTPPSTIDFSGCVRTVSRPRRGRLLGRRSCT